MIKRIVEFDGIRAFAILMIIACHLCYSFEPMSPVGQYLGGTFNCVFFLISAILAGSKDLPHNFLIRRILRLGYSLWPFLIIVDILYTILGIQFSTSSFIMNMCMLGWITKLPGLGHLWFVTMIMICYVMFSILNNVHISKRLKVILLFVISLFIQFALEYLSLPGYLGLVCLYCGLAYLYAHAILSRLDSFNLIIIVVMALVLNGYCLYGLYHKHFVIGTLPYYYITCMSGISVFLLLYKLFHYFRPQAVLKYISAISYELYLVHLPYCAIRIPVDGGLAGGGEHTSYYHIKFCICYPVEKNSNISF